MTTSNMRGWRMLVGTTTLALSLAACSGAGNNDQTAEVQPVACADLAALDVPDTTIERAELVAAGTFEAPAPPAFGGAPDYSGLPDFCRVSGSIAPTEQSDIKFELWLPLEEDWNGRFMQTGNGGAAGAIVYSSLIEPLSRGYAVANTDTGHSGGPGDFTWALNQPEKIVDYQYRAVNELTRVGKSLTRTRYGSPPTASYWYGCSTGGRQGLKEAQRFPEDYDVVVAGAPANNWSPLMMQSIMIQNSIGSDGLAPGKLGLLKNASIAACDVQDGVEDRVITEPGQCTFDPASLQCGAEGSGPGCLTETEVETARALYAGPTTENGETVMPGTGYGSEPTWAAYASPVFQIGSSFFRNAVVQDPEWDPATLDLERDLVRAEEQDQGAAKAMDPDLSAFIGRGGKLLLYHGTTDGLIPYGNTVNYYESVVSTLGEEAVADSLKLFLVPGMDHCSGGEGAFAIDWLSAAEDWHAGGDAPTVLDAAHPGGGDGDEGFTRPVCAYPKVPVYSGEGDETDAASFSCEAP